MKTILSILLLTFFIPAFSQHTRLNGYANYVFDDGVDSRYDANNYYDGTIKGGFQWGLGLEYLMHENKGIELFYLRQDTKAPITYLNGVGTPKFANFDVEINWITIGGNNYFRQPGGKVEGFGGFNLGMAIFDVENPTNNNSNSATKFAWGLQAGVNIWATPKVAIKLQTQLLSAVQSAGGGLYFGTGGSGGGVSAYSSMYQFGLGGGLSFNLGGSTTKK